MLADRVRVGSRKTRELIPVTIHVLEGFKSVDVYTGNGVFYNDGVCLVPDWSGEYGGEYEFLARIGRNEQETFMIEEGTYVCVGNWEDYYVVPTFPHWYTNLNTTLMPLDPFFDFSVVAGGLIEITEPIEIFYNVFED